MDLFCFTKKILKKAGHEIPDTGYSSLINLLLLLYVIRYFKDVFENKAKILYLVSGIGISEQVP